MATIKKRINISVSKQMDEALGRLAKRDQVPLASKAADLLEFAIDIEEDRYLEALATKRTKGKTTWVPHKIAWR